MPAFTIAYKHHFCLTDRFSVQPVRSFLFRAVNLFSIIFVLIWYIPLQGQEPAPVGAGLCGNIINAGTTAPVAGAGVFLEPGNHFSESDDQGFFQFGRLVPGVYHLLVQRLGYSPFRRQSIQLRAGEKKSVTIELKEKILEAADTISVTARRNPYTTMEIPYSRDLVTRAQLEQSRPLNLAEALQIIPGTFIKDYGSLGSLKTISLRGSGAEQVIVMLDGLKLNDPQTGQIDLSTLRIDGIESIEILRGGNSALYGADAVGGVVNIISKKDKTTGLKGFIDLISGSFHTASLTSELDLTHDWFSGSVGFRRLYSRGDFLYNDQQGKEVNQTNNDISANNVYANFNIRLQPKPAPLNLNLAYRFYQAQRGVPGTMELPSPTTRQWDTNQQFQAQLKGNIFNPLNTFHIHAGGINNRFKYESTDGLVPVDSRLSSGTTEFEIGMETILSPGNSLSYGLGLKYDWHENQSISNGHERRTGFAYLQDEATIPLHLFDTRLSFTLIPSSAI